MRPATLYPLIAVFFASICLGQSFDRVSPSAVERVATLLPESPAGYGPPCSDRATWGGATVVERTAAPRKSVASWLRRPVPSWDDEAYLEFSRNGSRIAGERMINARKEALYPLVLAECVEASGRYLEAIERSLDELAAQPTWTLPAHDRSLRNLRRRSYEIDLWVADTAHDIAQALYLIGDRLRPAVRQRARAALEERVFAPFRESLAGRNRDHFWLTARHNWNAVCLKGVVGAALAVIEDRRDRALFVAAGEHYIRNYLDGFAGDGYAVEGAGYWNYGFSHFVQLRELLRQATGERIDLFADARVSAIARYGYRIEMLPGNVAAFGDASTRVRPDEMTRAYVNEALGLGQPQRFAAQPLGSGRAGNDSPLFRASLLLFARPTPMQTAATVDPGSLDDYFAAAGVLVSRPNREGRLAVTIKAGGNGNHSHNDIGSYSLGLGSEQPVGDVGAPQYSARTFGPQRTSIPSISSWGHPVPVVDGSLQSDARGVTPGVLGTRFAEDGAQMLIDLKAAYPVAVLRSLTRELVHRRSAAGEVTVTDHFEAAGAIAFETAITTLGRWRRDESGELELVSGSQSLRALIEASAEWELDAVESDVEGLRFIRLGIRLKTPNERGFIRIRYLPSAT